MSITVNIKNHNHECVADNSFCLGACSFVSVKIQKRDWKIWNPTTPLITKKKKKEKRKKEKKKPIM